MIKSLVFLGMVLWLQGCSSHTQNPNERMMDNVMGELDRETSK